MTLRVFLSFNSRDGTLAQQVKAALDRLHPEIEIFFSPVSLGSGFWLPKLAEQIRTAQAFLLLLGPKGVGPWQEIEYHEAFDRHVQDQRFTLVPLILGGGQVPGLPFLRRLNWVDVPDRVDDQALRNILAALHGAPGPSQAALWKRVQPYRGLEAMTEANADYFYGRGAETCAILDLLRTKPQRLPLLIGASGVGKSSIALAGVFSACKAMRWPNLHGDGTGAAAQPWPAAFRDSRTSWVFLGFRPGAEPLHALAGAFVRLWQTDPTDPDRAALIGRWAEGLRTGANRLKDLLDATQETLAKRDDAAPARMLIYLDQAEELYTRAPCGPGSAGQRFAEELAATQDDPRLLAFGSLRADYFDRLQADRPLFDLYEHVDVPPMRADQLAEVVARPAAALGVTFEDERLPDRIVQAAAHQPGQLPLLAYMLTDMWSAMVARHDGCLRLPLEVIELGGVLAARAEQFLADNPGDEPWVKRLFTLRLALVAPEGAAVRRSALRDECDPREWALAERLADHPWRLVVTRERDPAGHEPLAELAHERLLNAWPRLEAWLREERDFLIFKAEAERAEKRWHDKGEPEGALYAGLDLAQAESWTALRGADLSEKVRAFVGRSVAADRAAKERALRFQRRVSRGVAAVAVLLLGLGAWANWERVEADRARRQAVAQNAFGRLLIDRITQQGTSCPKTMTIDQPLIEKAKNADLQNNNGVPFLLAIFYHCGIGVKQDYAAAMQWYQKAAKADDAGAARNIGIIYENGQGVPQDYAEAMQWYRRAADAGDTVAMVNIGALYDNAHGMPQDFAKAMEWYRRAADAGNAVAMRNIGVSYERGQGVPQDFAKAMEWYQKAADAGDAAGTRARGVLYEQGKGVPRDFTKAMEFYRKAADAGDAMGMRAVGFLYAQGYGVPQDYAKAMEWYQKAAGAGDAGAMGNVGVLYEHGEGVSQDYAKAMEFYHKAADAGDAAGMRAIGFLYDQGKGAPQDYAKAMEWYRKAADASDADAMNNIGFLYDQGKGVPRDYAKAMDWYQKAADAGDADAMVNIGVLYEHGEGVPQDYVNAMQWYQKAADAGDAKAMEYIGILYDNGHGVPQDYAKAMEWYQKAASAGNAGTRAIGVLYAQGKGVPQDHGKAMEWFQKAAGTGDAEAMNNIGVLYEHGYGVPQDYAKAMEWYQKAADAGNADAMNNIGTLYHNGYGVPQDFAKTMDWYQKAVDAGDAGAMVNIGALYDNGYGVPQDTAKAMEWYQKAVEAGDTDAMGNLSYAALRLRDFPRALAAAERAHQIAPSVLWTETNRAHALMFLGRRDEARALYMAHFGETIPDEDRKNWQQTILDDFAELRKAGLDDPLMKEIEQKFASPAK